MRNPRRIVLDEQAALGLKLDPTPPPPGSMFWRMWDQSAGFAEDALQTKFIQGIGAGNLDPNKYGAFHVSDAFYCFHGAPDYLAAADRVSDDVQLKEFLLKKYHSYDKYNKSFLEAWHIKDAGVIVPADVCRQYSEYETSIINDPDLDPVHCLIVMLPCEYLWFWLADKLSPPASGNIYAPWITGNLDPHGAYSMGNFINAYIDRHPGRVEPDRAVEIYRRAAEFEFLNFKSAAD